MKTQSKFYLIKVENNAISGLGFKYDLYNTSVHELQIWCGFKSIEDLYESAIEQKIHVYTILTVNTTSIFEEVY